MDFELFANLLMSCLMYSIVSDTPKDDLLSHFEECFNFIDEALSTGMTILVHW